MARKRQETRHEAAARAFGAMLAALQRYYQHGDVNESDVNRLLAAVVAHRQALNMTVKLGDE